MQKRKDKCPHCGHFIEMLPREPVAEEPFYISKMEKIAFFLIFLLMVLRLLWVAQGFDFNRGLDIHSVFLLLFAGYCCYLCRVRYYQAYTSWKNNANWANKVWRFHFLTFLFALSFPFIMLCNDEWKELGVSQLVLIICPAFLVPVGLECLIIGIVGLLEDQKPSSSYFLVITFVTVFFFFLLGALPFLLVFIWWVDPSMLAFE